MLAGLEGFKSSDRGKLGHELSQSWVRIQVMDEGEILIPSPKAAEVVRRAADNLERDYKKRLRDGIVDNIDSQLNTAKAFREAADAYDLALPTTYQRVWRNLLTNTELKEIEIQIKPDQLAKD